MVILLISHVQLLRQAVLAVLDAAGGVEAVGACCRDTAEAAALQSAPSLVLVDVSHPEAAALVAAVKAHVATVRVIMLATRQRDEDLLAWAEIGISGYLEPDASAHDLLSTVRAVEAGEVVYPPKLTALLLGQLADHASDRSSRAGVHALTSREQEVVALLADGLSNKLIAGRLCLAKATVKNHVHSVLEKWDVRSRGEAAARYRRRSQERGEAGLPHLPRARSVPTVNAWSGAQASSAPWSARLDLPSGYPYGRSPLPMRERAARSEIKV